MIAFVKHLERQNRWLGLSLTLAVAAAMSAPEQALAQDEGDMVLEEIMVTAQRREESLQDVPVSVSAFTGANLEKAGIREATEYLVMTPNVGFSEDGEGGSRSVNIAIRGVSNIALDGVAAANSIGYYIDEMSVGAVAQGTINPQLQDMERIEVLRGPQGTFFGRNAVGGAINITTRKPEDTFFFEGSAMAGNFGSWGLEGIINVPFSEKFMARAVVGIEESDTAITNINPTGNSGMGSGGTGDVLTGLVGGLLAQGYEAEDALVVGVYLHGLAGDRAAERVGQRALIARDLVAELGAVLKPWEDALTAEAVP